MKAIAINGSPREKEYYACYNTWQFDEIGARPTSAYQLRSVKNSKRISMNYAYILRCADGTLYTGWTNDLPRRIQTHNNGMGGKYTRSRLPVELVYYEEYEGKRDAQRREYSLKLLSRQEKIRLIESQEALRTMYFEYGEAETEYLKRSNRYCMPASPP